MYRSQLSVSGVPVLKSATVTVQCVLRRLGLCVRAWWELGAKSALDAQSRGEAVFNLMALHCL